MEEASMESKGTKATLKLHSMLRDLEEENDIHVPSEKHLLHDNLASLDMAVVDKDLQNNNNVDEDQYQSTIDEQQSCIETSLLDKEVDSPDDDIAIEDDDGWLLQTPSKEDRPERKSKFWLSEDVRTPELNRVKGSLASKVDLILIQTRKEKLSHLLAKHNLGSHSESAPGRLYQAESMCSIMSMDWEYDEDVGIGYHSRSMAPCSDSPIRNRRNNNQYFDENRFDDLQPMTLNFDSGSAIKPRKMRTSSLKSVDKGSNNHARRPSFSDRSDSSGDLPISPRSSLGSSRNSLDSGDGISIRKGKTSGKRNLLPIASFFDGPIPEEDMAFEYDHSSKILNPYAAWDIMRDHTVASNHGLHKSPSNQLDPSLTVKLPLASSDGPVVRRRAANPKASPMTVSADVVPRPRISNQSAVVRGKDQIVSPTQSKLQMARTRTGQSLTRKSLLPSQKSRLPQKSELSQSPDVLPRKDASLDRRSQSPDLIPRKSGVVRRGQVSSRSYQF